MAAAAVMWRLSKGPLPLSFLTPTIQQSMNRNLSGMKVTISDFILERDKVTGQPRFRLRNLALRDLDGNLIARAPRASVGVKGRHLLAGNIAPDKLELIGANLLVRRRVDGTFQLGFGDGSPANDSEPPETAAASSAETANGKSGRADRQDESPGVNGGQLLDLINDQMLSDAAGEGALAGIETIHVSQAAITLYDDANNAVWYAPQSNLLFKRGNGSFSVFVDAAVASGDKPWRSEVVVTYRKALRTFSVSARIFDLVPADIADDVFALSQLAQVKLPLSGHVEFELTEDGVMTKASAELSTKKGRLDFPKYISKPVLIDEGLLRFDLEPETGAIVIGNSAIFVEGVRSDLRGRLQPRRAADGRLTGIHANLRVSNVDLNPAAADQEPLALDRIEFSGTAGIDRSDVEVEDLILMSGGSGVRIRGRFVGEDSAVGMYLAGRIRDLPVDTLKRLWPPVVAPNVRIWLRKNVASANVSDGTFQLALPGKVLLAAIRDKVKIPDNMVDLKFKVDNVTTNYFGDLPAIAGASGKGSITGNNFRLELQDGSVALPSGTKLKFVSGTMEATELAPPLTPTVIKVRGSGSARGFLELLDQKPLGLISKSKFDPRRLSGDTVLDIRFDMPLQEKMRAELVKIQADAMLSNVNLKDAFNDLDIDSGSVDIKFGDGAVAARGPVKIKGIPVDLRWTRTFAKNGADLDEISAEADLNENRRAALDIDLSSHLTGPVSVTMNATTRDGKVSKMSVKADLTKASLRLDPIKWHRNSGLKTTAEFDVDLSNPNQTEINNLKISGKDFRIAGELKLGKDKELVEATFSDVLLNRLNHFALALKRRNDNLALAVTGKSFDARPIINSMFSVGHGARLGDGTGVPMAVETSIANVHANRGEVITNLTGQMQIIGGTVQQADLQGRFANGAPITLRVSPGSGGVREMRVVGNDGGGALRASNLYSKVAGGSIDFQAKLNPSPRAGIQQGKLVLRNFQVTNEQAIGEINQRQKKRGPRKKSLRFNELVLPFSTDERHVLIGHDTRIKSTDIGASAQGSINKINGILDIGGTIIPAYALNSALSDLPLVGTILTGGSGKGIIAMNFRLSGTMRRPKFRIDPVSAVVPGMFREILQTGGGGVKGDGTRQKKRKKNPGARRDQ